MIPAPAWTPSNPEYHATVSHWSSSMVKTFREAPAKAQGMYITGTIGRDKPTHAMVVGSAVNVLLLEPQRAETYIHVVEVKARTAKEYKNAVELRPYQLVLTLTEWEEAEAVATSILQPRTQAARVAHELLTNHDGFSEYAYRWEDPSGVLCKLMVDRLRLISGYPTIVELKTTVDPSPEAFEGHFWRMDYHCQAAFNRRGLTAHVGVVPRFLVVAVRSEPPFDVFVYQANDALLAIGTRQIETDLAAIARCLAGAPWETPAEALIESIPYLSPPRWAMRELDGNLPQIP